MVNRADKYSPFCFASPDIMRVKVSNRQTDRQILLHHLRGYPDFFFQLNLLPPYSLCKHVYFLTRVPDTVWFCSWFCLFLLPFLILSFSVPDSVFFCCWLGTVSLFSAMSAIIWSIRYSCHPLVIPYRIPFHRSLWTKVEHFNIKKLTACDESPLNNYNCIPVSYKQS